MTDKQKARYWREWGQIRKLLTEQGEFSKEDADAERKEIHRKALGTEKSSKDLTNGDLDKIFKAFAAYLVLINGPSSGPDEDQPRKRLVWAIEQLGLGDPYLIAICSDQFHTPDWRKLPMADLEKFRFTASARAQAKKRASRQP